MPRGDQTGPMGTGAMTGKGLGYCSGVSTSARCAGTGLGLARRNAWAHGSLRGGSMQGPGRGMRRNMSRRLGRGMGFNKED